MRHRLTIRPPGDSSPSVRRRRLHATGAQADQLWLAVFRALEVFRAPVVFVALAVFPALVVFELLVAAFLTPVAPMLLRVFGAGLADVLAAFEALEDFDAREDCEASVVFRARDDFGALEDAEALDDRAALDDCEAPDAFDALEGPEAPAAFEPESAPAGMPACLAKSPMDAAAVACATVSNCRCSMSNQA